MLNSHCFNTAALNEILSGSSKATVAACPENEGVKLALTFESSRVKVFANPETEAQKIPLGGSMTKIVPGVETQSIKVGVGASATNMLFKTFWQNPVFISSGFGPVFNEPMRATFNLEPNLEPDDKVKYSHKIFNLNSVTVILVPAEGEGTKYSAGGRHTNIPVIPFADWSKYTEGSAETVILLIPEGSGYWYRRLYAMLSVLERQIRLEVE